MLRTLGKAGAAVLAIVACVGCQARTATPPINGANDSRIAALRISPADITWHDLPGQPGVREAILSGDPAAAGLYVLRRLIPARNYAPPHWHPHVEYGTVISGTFYIAIGDSLTRRFAIPLRAGGFIQVPPFTAHANWTDEEVILQIHGPGPRKTTYGRPP